MAKTTRSTTAAKPAQKGKATGKSNEAKVSKAKVAATKSAHAPAPAKKAVAKKPPVKAAAKPVPAKKAVEKHVAKPVAKPQPKKAAPAPAPAKKEAVKPEPKHSVPAKPAPVKKAVEEKAVAKSAPKPAHVPAKPELAAKQPARVAQTATHETVSSKAKPPIAGKVASAVGTTAARVANATANHSTTKNQKTAQSSMNSTATTLDNGVTREDGRYALPLTTHIDLPPGYRPSSDEEYMNPRHLAYFRNKLREWREQLVEESRQTMENLRDEVRDVGDEAERATRETENSLELRTRDRYRKLISKIDKALRRIEEGRYGFCEETDEEIGLERLDARPIATLSLDAQERREHLQKQMGD
jgi:DnaK suppressor protein